MTTPRLDPPARLLVCERSGSWAVALRQKLSEAGIRVWESRSLADCRAEIARSPSSLVVLELTLANLQDLLATVQTWDHDYPQLQWVAVADRSLAEYEGLLREAGAIHFTSSPRQAGWIAQLACRHLAQITVPPQSLPERIWSSLPWRRHLTEPEGKEVPFS